MSPTISEVKTQYQRLSSLGLGNTQNALALKNTIDNLDTQIKNKDKAKELISFISSVHKYISKNSILISNEQFNSLCDRYNLRVTLLPNYCGVIPEKNIQDIENVKSRLKQSPILSSLNFIESGYLLFVDDVVLYPKDTTVLENYLRKHKYVIPVNGNTPWFDGWFHGSNLADNVNLKVPNLSMFIGKIITNEDLLIACPSKFINHPEIQVTKAPVDPIVFQYTPFGVLIHTVWGEEAEDKVLKEYLELNTKISQL